MRNEIPNLFLTYDNFVECDFICYISDEIKNINIKHWIVFHFNGWYNGKRNGMGNFNLITFKS